MKSILITLASGALALSVAAGASAQGRHDEKPHGVSKPAAEASKEARSPGTGGRHDEGGSTHGKKRAPAKKNADADSPLPK